MPRLPVLILGVAGVLLTAGLTALVALGESMGAWSALAAGGVVAIIGWGASTRWAGGRFAFLRPLAMELGMQRDACLALRVMLKKQRASGELESWGVWRARIDAWDKAFWQFLERRLPDVWSIYRRETPVLKEDYGDQWPRDMFDFLEGRWQLCKRIAAEQQ